MGGLFGLGGNSKAEQEKLGQALANLSDQIAKLQQQNLGKDGEIAQLKADLDKAKAAGTVGDTVKQQISALQSSLAVAEADKQANELMLQSAQKQIADLKSQLDALKASASTAGAMAGAVAESAPVHTAGGLSVGASAWVRREGGKNLRRRGGPSLSADVIDGLAPGTQLALLEGPVDADGHRWWRVRAGDGREGWVAGEELVTQPE